MRRRVFGPQLNHEAVGIDELRGDDIDGAFEIEDNTCGAMIDLGETNLLEAMIADLDGFGAVMRGRRWTQTVQVVVEARWILDLIRGELVGALRLDSNAGHVTEGPEADGFYVRTDGRLRLTMRQGAEDCEDGGKWSDWILRAEAAPRIPHGLLDGFW
jgi:hypothetical protein